MKALLSLVAAVSVLACSTAQAARIAVVTNGPTASVFLKAGLGSENGGDLNGQFDTVDFAFTPTAPAALQSITSGAGPRPAGDPFTYRNRVLDADPLDDGLGWSIVGQSITANGVVWAGGPLGLTISTGPAAGPGLFLQNFQFNGPANKNVGTGRVQLIRAGTIVAEIPIVVPEPTTIGLFATSLVGLLGLRRRLA